MKFDAIRVGDVFHNEYGGRFIVTKTGLCAGLCVSTVWSNGLAFLMTEYDWDMESAFYKLISRNKTVTVSVK